jgi:hypothetical protein
MLTLTEKEQILIIVSSLRYYMGRSTIAVSSYVRFLEENWEHLTNDSKWLIEREVEREIERDDVERVASKMSGKNSDFLPLGMDCDRDQWDRLRKLWHK